MAQGNPYSTADAPFSSDKTSRVANEIHDRATDVADRLENAVKSVADKGREVSGNVQQVADNVKSAVDTSVKDQPMATLAVAAALGFVLGALWKS